MDEDVTQIKYDFFINKAEVLSSSFLFDGTSVLVCPWFTSVYTLIFEPGALEFGLKAAIWSFFCFNLTSPSNFYDTPPN